MEAIAREVECGVLAGRCEIAAVLANRASAPGVNAARRDGLPVQVVPSRGLDTEAYGSRLLQTLDALSPDLVVLAGFMRILSADVVAAYRGRIVNIHPADTAAYQGPDGYGWAARERLDRTTITVHLVDGGIDTGPVLCQENVSLVGTSTREEICARGLAVEHRLYSRCLATLLDGEHDRTIAAFQRKGGG